MNRSLRRGWRIGALAAFWASVSFAAEPESRETPDVLQKKDGRVVHGRLREIVPGDHVTLEDASGEPTTFPWAEIEQVVVGGAPSAAGSGLSGSSAPSPPPMVGPLVRVHIVSRRTVYLHRRAANAADFVRACESPCDVDLPLGDTYKVSGSGMTTSREFRIVGSPGDTIAIDVSGPSWLGIAASGTAIFVGGLTAYVGLVLAAAGGASGVDTKTSGLVVLAGGGALLGLGLLAIFPSMRTDVSQQTKTKPETTFVRVPAWRASSLEEHSLPRPTSVLFEHRF